MDRNNDVWKLFTFGMNDENGHLIEIKMPARNYAEAVRKVKMLICMDTTTDPLAAGFWLNDEEDYN